MQGNITSTTSINWCWFTSTKRLLRKQRQLKPARAPAGATVSVFENWSYADKPKKVWGREEREARWSPVTLLTPLFNQKICLHKEIWQESQQIGQGAEYVKGKTITENKFNYPVLLREATKFLTCLLFALSLELKDVSIMLKLHF